MSQTLGLPPRQIRSRKHAGFIGLIFVRLFILPHTLLGLGLLLLLLSKFTLAIFGQQSEARVLKKTTQAGSKGGATYKVAYSFTHNVTEYSGNSQIDQAIYQQLRESRSIPIVYLSFLPQYVSDYREPGHFFPANTGSFFLIAIFWNGVVGVFIYVLYIDPWRRKQLIRHGTAAMGRIEAMSIQRGSKGAARYMVNYSYEVENQRHEASISTTREQYEAHQIGESVAITYDPVKPKRSVPVDLSPWELAPAHHVKIAVK